MKRFGHAFLLIFCLAIHPAVFAAVGPLEGSIRIVGGPPEQAIMLSVNGSEERPIVDGRFEHEIGDAEIVQLRFSGPGVFTSVQTFSRHEVAQGPLPTIELVARAEGRVELIFGGDVMAGRRYIEPIWGERQLIQDETRLEDMKALLAPMKPYFETSDLASVNLETVLFAGDPPAESPKSIVFYTHPDLAEALKWMGIDHVTLGNNHVYDYLEPGLATTIAALDAAGLQYSGAGMDDASAIKPSRIDLEGNPLSLIGTVGWAGTVEPNQIAETAKGGAAHGTEEALRAAVQQARTENRRAIVQYHGNREYSDAPTEVGRERLYAVVDEGAPLVVGHHPHVTHGLEIRDGSLIAWSLGNFLFDQYFIETQRAIALRVWLDQGEFYRAEVIPVQLLDYRPVPATDGQRQALLQRISRLTGDNGTSVSLSGGHLALGGDALTPWMPPKEQLENLYPGGDFEAARWEASVDRSWQVDGGVAALMSDGLAGNALLLTPEENSCTISWTTKTFFRVVESGHYRLSFDAKGADDSHPMSGIQAQPKGMSRFDALETAPWEPLILVRDGDELTATFEASMSGDDALPFRLRLNFAEACDGVVIDNIRVEHVEP